MATWSNISNASNPTVEVKVPPQAGADLKPLCDVLDEGFRRWLMAHSNEMVDIVESVEKAVLEHSNQLSAVGVGIMELQKEAVGEISRVNARLSTLAASIDTCAKNIDMIEDSMPLIVNAIKGIKLDANIPITNLSVGLPRFVVWYAVVSPIIFSLGAILAMRLF